ncbi:DrmB family protein [Clostridium botulinum]|uniref:DrmB family protein n=1 Tax=Clostridium botulinum TaxID=1491 RepID=UPI003DA45F98
MSREELIPREINNVRISQIISTFGPGAIMDFRDQTLMTAAPKFWNENYDVIHDERLGKKLHVDEFRIHKDMESNRGVPFVRFPGWYFCPRCKKFQHISKWEKEYKEKNNKFMLRPMCMKCKISIIPASVLITCKNGHIDDFPWIEWAHLHEGKICNKPQLKIISNSGILGLEGFRVECTKCGASNSLKGAFNEKTFKNIIEGKIFKCIDEGLRERFKCTGNMPWKGIKEKSCKEIPTPILRNASNIYFTKIESSIVIPPYSDKLNTKIENSHQFEYFLNNKIKNEKRGKLESFLKEDFEYYIKEIAKEIEEEDNIHAIRKIMERKIEDSDESIDENCNRNFYRAEEYDALLGKIAQGSFNSDEFKIVLKNSEEYGMEEISKVTLVKKLKEVRALVGYTRIKPPLPYIMGADKSSDGSKVVSIKEYEDRWYPAYEVRGEGIFIELNTKLIDKWEENDQVKDRAEKLNCRYNKGKNEELKREITPKFILLHTFAHALIKELSSQCGYSSTSLRERIYCDLPKEDVKMSGILIYTASGDSEGSLGGLVKQGNPEILSRIIINVINRVKWCSSDPVCINSSGQGRDSLNLASCHNCVLLPETSCEEFNVLLDRAMLVGTLEDKGIGFFNNYL